MTDPLLQNRLLAALTDADRDALRPHFQAMAFELAYPFIKPNEPVRYAYFPVSCLGSLVIILEDGSTVESGSVGREGMVGVPVLLGAESTPMQTLVQIAGEAFRIDAHVLREHFERRDTLHAVLNR